MPDEWIIRVEGKEYGPADLPTLREWKSEGRVLPANDARLTDAAAWDKASEIPGLFDGERPPVQQLAVPKLPRPVSTKNLLPETFKIYTRGFFKYFGLTMLWFGPSLCAQLTSAFVDATPGTDADMRTLVAGAFAGSMFLLWLIMSPIYIAGIQILTAAYAAGERISFFATLNEAVKFWPRVTLLWIFVFVCYFLCAVIGVPLILTTMLGGLSFLSIFLLVLMLSLTSWIIGRLWVTFMFWQQFAVLEGCTALESLRRSRELARSGRDLPWYRRPMWRGVFIVSLWGLLVLTLYWPFVSQFFQLIWTIPAMGITDPQKLWEAIQSGMKNSGSAGSTFAAGVLNAILTPLQGIAFVLLFLDSNVAPGEE